MDELIALLIAALLHLIKRYRKKHTEFDEEITFAPPAQRKRPPKRLHPQTLEKKQRPPLSSFAPSLALAPSRTPAPTPPLDVSPQAIREALILDAILH